MPTNEKTGRPDHRKLSPEEMWKWRLRQHNLHSSKVAKGKQAATGSKTSPSTMLEGLQLDSGSSLAASESAPTPSDSPAQAPAAACDPSREALFIKLPPLKTLRQAASFQATANPDAAPPRAKTPLFLPSPSPAPHSLPRAISPVFTAPLSVVSPTPAVSAHTASSTPAVSAHAASPTPAVSAHTASSTPAVSIHVASSTPAVSTHAASPTAVSTHAATSTPAPALPTITISHEAPQDSHSSPASYWQAGVTQAPIQNADRLALLERRMDAVEEWMGQVDEWRRKDEEFKRQLIEELRAKRL